MKGIVSVLKFPDNNVYRIRVERFTNQGIKVNSYVADYLDLKKVVRLSDLALRMERLLSNKLIATRYAEKSHRNYITDSEKNIIEKGLHLQWKEKFQ